MKMSNIAAVVLFIAKLFIAIKPSLPELIFNSCDKEYQFSKDK